MPIDPIRAALVALLSQPIAVLAVVVLAGIHAAIWSLVFQRLGYPPALASLLLVPPLTLLVPLYVALVRWPSQRLVRVHRSLRGRRARTVQRHVQRRVPSRPVLSFRARGLRLAEDGLPRVRIPFEPMPAQKDWPAYREAATRYHA